ncbi:MAG: hypothetical protein GX092_04480 [Clostridia bacterium]|jgi:hypothetical protein|nr:hypothetical protein [Clostridia bacterium]
MANNQNNKDFAKNYQQKAKQNAKNINSYEAFQQESAAELTKPNQNYNTNTQQYKNQNNNQYQQYNKQYQQEAGSEFLGNKQAGANRSGYIMPDLNEESGIGMNADKAKKANKNNLDK